VTITTGNSESQTIERCRTGDRDAFRLLYDAHKDRVYSLALYTLNGDAATAEDVAQEVFLRLARRDRPLAGYDPARASLSTFLTVLATSAAIDHLRPVRRLELLFHGR